MTEYLSIEDVLQLVRRFDLGPVRDLGLLESAVLRPQSSLFGADAYPSLPEKAAALLESVAANHALVDGNKRLCLIAVTVFLDLNGFELDLSDDEAFDLVMSVADRSARGVEAISPRLLLASR